MAQTSWSIVSYQFSISALGVVVWTYFQKDLFSEWLKALIQRWDVFFIKVLQDHHMNMKSGQIPYPSLPKLSKYLVRICLDPLEFLGQAL